MLVQIQVLLMQIFSGSLAKFRDDERGASAIEYAIMAAVLIGRYHRSDWPAGPRRHLH